MVIEPGNNLNTTGSAASGSQKARPAAGQRSNQGSDAPASTPKAREEVSLSLEGQNLSRVAAQLSETPEVDTDKVEQVRAALANGSYQVDANAIAGAMLEQDSLLGE